MVRRPGIQCLSCPHSELQVRTVQRSPSPAVPATRISGAGEQCRRGPAIPLRCLVRSVRMGLGAGDGATSLAGARLAAEGCASTGATMSVAHRAPPASGGCHRCGGGGGGCVSIYVNNNVQGVTNSVVVGSKVAVSNAGARVRSLRRRRGDREGKQQKVITRWKKTDVAVVLLLWTAAAAAAAASAMLCLAVVLLVSFVK
ncbi:hypothetical protein ACP70R_020482 [Stipagrostis hirtigluma subsp. patula]